VLLGKDTIRPNISPITTVVRIATLLSIPTLLIAKRSQELDDHVEAAGYHAVAARPFSVC
jgi:hypothetical protein